MEQYSAILKKSGNQYLALCLELGVVGSGNTPTTAKKCLQEAIESFLEYARDEGLPDERPISIKELHEFLYYDDLFKEVKRKPESRIALRFLKYA